MKIAIYSPYLDTYGGGERYMMTIAEILSIQNHNVDVCLNEHLDTFGGENLKSELSKRFDLDLTSVNFIKSPLGKGLNYFPRLNFLKKYDVLFYLTDGSIFIPSAKRNILHIQSPLPGQPVKSLWGRLKLKKWDLIIYNSQFTKTHSEKNWPLVSEVIYPPIDVYKIKSLKKKNYILSVGRFFGYLKDKKQELLIKTFRSLCEKEKLAGWSLNLAGSAKKGDEPYLDELKKLAINLPVNFYPNVRYDDLINLYGESSIYWHASGFGEEDPTKMEHFGISTVEAMAAGCVPVVLGKGGQVEIVEDSKSGYLWNNPDQLKKITLQLINNKGLMEGLSKQAVKRAKEFDKKKFEHAIMKILKSK